ncbi:hypothetical protein HYALB_00005627 [Hymenoscyphus albidus]|uniref:Uncharacterized protein n=1 Tax=Hymenoscyphus albidus TaxID=595503 RepID=A0A9N9LI11_9HELO|nr:hypothetical protein HYALB_00005627 [Hymenoscyphus albidus]
MEPFQTASSVGGRRPRTLVRSHSMLPLPFEKSPERPYTATRKGNAANAVPVPLTPRRQRCKAPEEKTPTRSQACNASDSKLPQRPSTLPRNWAGTGKPKKSYPALGDTFSRSARATSPFRPPSRINTSTPFYSVSPRKATPRKGTSPMRNSIPNFAPSNHHPDLLATITPGGTTFSQEVNAALPNVVAQDSTNAMQMNSPPTPPMSPHIPALDPDLSDISSLEDFSSHSGGSPPHSPRLNAQDTSTDLDNSKESLARRQYAAQEGLLWNNAKSLLEQDFLHPVNLNESEFVSLVCGKKADRPEWFRINLATVIKRTIDQWMRAHRTLVKAGIPPSELRKESLNAFEFMNDTQQSHFIQSYKLAERQILNAGDALQMTQQERDYFALLPLPDKYNFINNYTDPPIQGLESSGSPQLNSRQSRVDLLKSKKADKLKALQEKLNEMKQIEQDIRELEERGSLSDCVHDEDLTSAEVYDDDHLEMDFGKKALAELEDPFVDQPESPTKGNIFHEYTLSERTNLPKQTSTSHTPEGTISDQRAKIPYDDSAEYRDFMDDSWHCFEDLSKADTKAIVEVTALPLPIPEATDPCCETESISTHESMPELVLLDTISKSNDQIKETSTTPNGYTVVRKVSDNMDIESFATVGEQARIFAQELSEIAKILESGVHSFSAIEDRLQQANYRASLDSAICLPETTTEMTNALPKSHHTTERKTSMTTILSESSTTSDKLVLKDVTIATPDVGYESSRSSHVEYMGPLFARERASHASEEGTLRGTLSKKSGTVRKKLSQFFGSIRRKESRRDLRDLSKVF